MVYVFDTGLVGVTISIIWLRNAYAYKYEIIKKGNFGLPLARKLDPTAW